MLCPGDLLPLNLKHAEERSLAQQAITAEQPLTGMIAVVRCLVLPCILRLELCGVRCRCTRTSTVPNACSLRDSFVRSACAHLQAGLHRHSFLRHSIHQVGCLAEVRQLRHHQDGSLVLICRGGRCAARHCHACRAQTSDAVCQAAVLHGSRRLCVALLLFFKLHKGKCPYL